MAQCLRYVCDNCGNDVEAWDEGNPYYIDASGKKQYAYHPDHGLLEKCIGNDSPHLCLECGEEFMVDSRAPIAKCPRCGSEDIANCYRLAGRRCPKCKAGAFRQDPDFHCIS